MALHKCAFLKQYKKNKYRVSRMRIQLMFQTLSQFFPDCICTGYRLWTLQWYPVTSRLFCSQKVIWRARYYCRFRSSNGKLRSCGACSLRHLINQAQHDLQYVRVVSPGNLFSQQKSTPCLFAGWELSKSQLESPMQKKISNWCTKKLSLWIQEGRATSSFAGDFSWKWLHKMYTPK